MQIKELLLNKNPEIKIYENFFNNDVCNKIINLSNGKLKQACVGKGTKNVIRTGRNCYINKEKDKFTRKIINKISNTIGKKYNRRT